MLSSNGILVKAKIRLLTAEEDGRTTPVTGSYRPNHNFFAPDDQRMAVGSVELPEGIELHPGGSIELQITFWNWEGLKREIYPGREWRIQEGAKLVGFGTVCEMLSVS